MLATPAGLYALDNHIERLAEDHAHAQVLAQAVGVEAPTNIVAFDVPDAAAL
ncbi:MAG: hypothetical protein V9E81_06925 [Marmoricola sp.]